MIEDYYYVNRHTEAVVANEWECDKYSFQVEAGNTVHIKAHVSFTYTTDRNNTYWLKIMQSGDDKSMSYI